MRCNIQRLFTLSFIIFGTTLVLLSLPRNNPSTGEWEDPEHNFIQPHQLEDVPNPKISSVAGQNQLPHQPPPPALTSGLDSVDPFGFPSSLNRVVLSGFHKYLKSIDLESLSRTECPDNITLSQYWIRTKQKEPPVADSWEQFYSQIGSCSVYTEEKTIDKLLYDLNRMPIRDVHIMDGGTQVKLVFTYENNKQAVFKPMRFGRDYESDPNHFYFSDFERHNAEIATYHLDKVLGFRRAVPTVGRILNMTSELLEKAEKKLKKTFFVSPAKNRCFVSRCDYYCDTTHAICGQPDLKEGSVQVFLPDESYVPRKHNKSPYRRTYSKKNQIAEWQSDMNYCSDKVKTKKQYAHGRRLLDLIDMHIMDYLIGNQDRHHFESFSVFNGMPSYAIHLDHGRAFGRSDFDDDDILLPLRQCCIIRPSTLNTLLQFYSQPRSLVKALHRSMSKDPVSPILHYKHYPAIERRLGKLMEYLLECFDRKSASKVVVPVFHNPNVPEEDLDEEEKSEEDTAADPKDDKKTQK